MPALAAAAADFLLTGWLVLAVLFALLWWRQTVTRNATAVDAAWSGSIGGMAAIAALLGSGSGTQRALAAIVAAIWSGRLTAHLVSDRVGTGAPEDGRYRALRSWLGRREQLGFFAVYQLQAGLALGFAAPFVCMAWDSTQGITGLQVVGLGLAAASLALETIADRQLAAHRRDPTQTGRTCRTGLWRYSRHPNYFFEWLTWCGFGLVHSAALGWFAVLTPVAMLLTVRFGSGVPFTEKRALASRGADYRDYMRTTNTFFPWPPRPVSRATAPLETPLP
ncbi:MAG: DUF1295 domain-containing protein [Planctomycetes bacterium]|nr:DUF1295 domain-containing protein [Planctomycetota bacterium]